jgi:hypothetical protein
MYDLISDVINHNWITTGGSGEQTYVYAVACIVLVVLLVKFIDLVESVFHRFTR